MRKLQILALVVAVCCLCGTGLSQSKRRVSQASGRYPAKRVRWKGPAVIKALNMRLLTTLYGDVSNPNGIAVPDDVIQNFDLSPDGNTLVCTYFPTTLIVWDTQTGRRKKVVEPWKSGFGDVAFSPDGKWFVTGPGNLASETGARTITFWDAHTYKATGKIVSAGSVQSVKFSPDGKVLAVVSDIDDGTDNSKTVLQLWDVQSRRLAAAQPAKGRSIDGSMLNVMSQIAFSPDGSKLVTSTKQTVEIWDIHNGELVQSLPGQRDVTSVWFSPDGHTLISTSEQRLSVDQEPVGELTIWNALDGQKVKTLPGYNYAVFSPDGKLIASGSKDKAYSVIDVKTGSVVGHLPAQLGPLRFSRNGKRAASYDDLVVVRTWQVLD